MIVKNENVFHEKVDIFFQYFYRISASWIAFFLLRFLISLITSTFPAGLKEKELPLFAFYAFCIAAILGCLLYFITDFNVGHHLRLRSMLFDSGIWSEDAVFEEYSLKMLPTSFWRSTILLMCFKVIEKADFVLSEKEVL